MTDFPEYTVKAIADLIPYARNARTHSAAQVDKIAASIREFGFLNPIITDGSNGIVAGHGRVMAAQKLGLERLPCVDAAHLSAAQKRAYVLADNRLALDAEWDNDLLKIELQDLETEGFDLSLTGFEVDEVQAFLADEPTEGLTDEDAVPEVSEQPVTVEGDVWLLGRHRLMCGDSGSFDDVQKVGNSSKFNLVVTSPPYASQREYDTSTKFKPVKPSEYVDWYEDISTNILANLSDDGSYFCNIKPNAEGLRRELYVFDLVLAHVRRWGWNFADEFCWERNGIPQQVSTRLKNQFEPIYHFTKGEWKFRPDEVKHHSKSVPKAKGKGAGNTNAAARQGHVSAVDGNKVDSGMAYPGNRLPTFQSEALGHPAAYPVGLAEFFIKAYTDIKDVIFDPFMGSGSTLMAAEKNNRLCYGIEVSPVYTDIVIRRWQDFTGQTATLEATGQAFAELEAERHAA